MTKIKLAPVCLGCGTAKIKPKEQFCTMCRADGTAKRYVAPVLEPEAPVLELGTHDLDESADFQQFPTVELDYEDPSMQELAKRTLARRGLLGFIMRFKPKYDPGWVHRDICRRLERFVKDVEDGKEPRLLLMMPVRHGKSEIASRHLAPWVLGKHPDWEIIAASGAQSLAMSFSRYIRDLIRDPSYQAVFPNMRLDPSSQSVENWNSTMGGGYLAAGIGTMITGRGCFVGRTLINSEVGEIQISTLVRLFRDGRAPRVYAYDHSAESVVLRDVEAAYEETPEQLISITTAAGRSIVCTAEHPVYVVGRGYVEAALLSAGDTVYNLTDMPEVRAAEGPVESADVQDVLLCDAGGGDEGTSAVFKLFGRIHKAALRAAESAEARARRCVLFSDVLAGTPRGEERKTVRNVQQTSNGARSSTEREVLLNRVPSGSAASKAHQALYAVRSNILVLLDAARVLLSGMQERSTFGQHAGRSEFALQGWHELQSVVSVDASVDSGAGQRMRGVRSYRGTAYTPHERAAVGQLRRESSAVMHNVPCETPQIKTDTVSVVIAVRVGGEPVYDIQVAKENNYFAGAVLVHNCHILIVDDPVKDAEAADSQGQRDATWEWYMSTAYTRLAPGGGVLGIMTWWNDDDWAGRIQQSMATGDGDMFEIVKYPAINDLGDEYILPDDSMVQLPEGSSVPEGAVLTRVKGTALHPERYTAVSLLKRKASYYALGQQRWWSALYQQNPSPEEGAYFTKKMFKTYDSEIQRRGKNIYQAWDFAITTGTQNDWTVGCTILQDEHDNLYVLDVNRFRSDDGMDIVDTIIEYAKAWEVDLVGFEDGQIWKALSSTFTKACEQKHYYPSYEVMKPLTDKMVRAQPLRGRMQASKLYWPSRAAWYEDLKNEFLRFPAGTHDDQIDSIAWAVRLTLAKAAPKPPAGPVVKSWKDKMKQYTEGGSGGGHMAA